MPLEQPLLDKLREETEGIEAAPDPKAMAAKRYANARRTEWFRPVVSTLEEMAGPGGRCMLCSGSEASDVEHFRPKAVFPEQAMTWENYLWACTICNRKKGSRFPPITESGGQLINPIDEDPWDFFFIDEYGLMTPRYHPESATFDERATSTRDILDLDRDALRDSRASRYEALSADVRELLDAYRAGRKTETDVQVEIRTLASQPFQLDVADFFLRGPGRAQPPFREFFEEVDITP